MNKQSSPKSLATMKAGATALLPIYPETFDDVVRLSRMAIYAGMVKPLKVGYGDNAQTEDERATEARATMIIMQGMELGLPPMQSVQLLAMINGRITAHSEAVPGILLSKGFKIEKTFVGKEYDDDFKAVCRLTRPDGQVFVGEFSVKDAKEAGLWDENATITKFGKTKPNDSAWYRYKKRMLWARALGFATKDGGADATKGLMVREEVEDMLRSRDAVDITPDVPMIENDVPEIPEIPDDVPELPPDDEASGLDDPAGEMLPEVEQGKLISKLKEDLALCKSYSEREEVAEQYEDILDRLSDANRRRVEAIFEGREK